MVDGELLFFTGTECVHCHHMEPLIERLEKEEKVKVKRLEVWHNAANAKILQQLDKGYCGGIPFFYNKKTGKWVCGAVPYERLRSWALGK